MGTQETAEALFARQVRGAREKAGMSQTALAKALSEHGVKAHMTTVAKIEAGDRSIRLNEAVALSRILGIDLPVPANKPVKFKIDENARLLRHATDEYEGTFSLVQGELLMLLGDATYNDMLESMIAQIQEMVDHVRWLTYGAKSVYAIANYQPPPNLPGVHTDEELLEFKKRYKEMREAASDDA